MDSLDTPGTQATSREDVIQQDVKDLHRLGYAQELFRTMGGFSNFAISFSIISILTGAVILDDYGLAWAGTAASLIGIGLPHRRRPLLLGQPDENQEQGWWTAWLNLIGQFAIVAGINYAAALFLNATIITPLTGGAYSNTAPFIAPNVNSYKRYAVASWAPVNVVWGRDNRTTGFRIVGDGPIETPLLMDWLLTDEAARQLRLARNPAGRFGKPEEIVNLAIYLASDESRWTNGAAMVVDGGISVNYF